MHRFARFVALLAGFAGFAGPAAADILVDDFEDVSDWRGLDRETAIVHGGAAAGRWDDHVGTTGVSKDFAPPLDASGEAHLQVWLWSAVANGAQIDLVLDSDNDADPAGWDYYDYRFTVDWTGWRLLRVPLADFRASRVPVGWHELNSIRLSADGWSHVPLPDTLLILDDLSFGTGALADLRTDTRRSGADFVYRYTATLEERAGRARTLAVAAENEAGSPFTLRVLDPSVALPAGGSATAVVEVTVPGAAISPATALDVHRVTLSVLEGAALVDGATLEPAVPFPARDHPRTLLDAADLTRIAGWAATYPWAGSARDGIVRSADGWPTSYESEYGLAHWSLPPEGGQWTLWYVCPTHGVRLRYEGSGRHVCPVDGEVFTGWPYDQVVYTWMHSDLAAFARDLGLAWRLTGNPLYAAGAADILRAYAAAYAGYELHNIDGEPSGSAARVLAQTLDEAGWLIPIAWAYDLIADSPALDDEARTAIEHDLLRAAAATIRRNPTGMSNWQSWHNAAVAAVGFALDDPTLLAAALRDPANGLEYQLAESVSADGFWYEGSWGYHFYALDALIYTAEMAQRAGDDAYGHPALRGMLEAPVRFAMPDGSLPAFNDSGTSNVRSQRRHYEAAWNRYADPLFAAPLSATGRGRDALLWGAATVPETDDLAFGSLLFPDAGYAVLRTGAGDDASYLALDYGPHGGWHGHYDKLGFVLYARGAQLAIDPGTQSYAAPTHDTWDKVTVAHNTVVVDETTQAEATGVLHRFAALPDLAAAAADAGEACATATLERSLLLCPEYAIDRFDVAARDGAAHDVDWIVHVVGQPSTDLPLAPYSGFPSSAGYQHLTGERSASTADAWSVDFDANGDAPTTYGSVWADDPAIVASFEYSREQAATGSWSGRLAYDFSAATGYVLYSTPAPPAVGEAPAGLRLAVWGDGSGHRLGVRLYDATDERFVGEVGPIDWTGWRTVEVADLPSWSHYLGNDDGVFDLPIARASVELTHVAGGPAAGALYVDDVTVLHTAAGPVLLEDFEVPARALRLTMLGAPDTTVVVGQGLGPDLLDPVPFAMARRHAADTTFAALLETYGDAPRVATFVELPTDAAAADGAAAFRAAGAEFADDLLWVVAGPPGTPRTFGEGRCDGTLCLVRLDAADAPMRLGLVEGARLERSLRPLLESSASLAALQVDYRDAGTRLDLDARTPIASELRVWGPDVAAVYVNGAATPFDRDGDYVVLNLVPSVEPDGGPGDADADADSDADAGADGGPDGGLPADGSPACGCGVTGEPAGSALLALLLGLILLRRRRRTR
ncbi:MAG: heparinase II/III family protein [Deltaproteobacteria bacterium]|nr:heparinase II/III family protein [Deltaproteobacteria bacterium]